MRIWRLTSSSFAGTDRTEVAVGTLEARLHVLDGARLRAAQRVALVGERRAGRGGSRFRSWCRARAPRPPSRLAPRPGPRGPPRSGPPWVRGRSGCWPLPPFVPVGEVVAPTVRDRGRDPRGTAGRAPRPGPSWVPVVERHDSMLAQARRRRNGRFAAAPRRSAQLLGSPRCAAGYRGATARLSGAGARRSGTRGRATGGR